MPSEVVKQRAQVSASSKTLQIFSTILSEEVRLPLGPLSSSSAEGDGFLVTTPRTHYMHFRGTLGWV